MFEIRFNSKMDVDYKFKKNFSRQLRRTRSKDSYIQIEIQPKNGKQKPYHD